MTIRVWNLDQGRRSMRAGMVLRIVGASAVPDADAIVHLRLGVFLRRLLPQLPETTPVPTCLMTYFFRPA
jgi:hypothetical protein